MVGGGLLFARFGRLIKQTHARVNLGQIALRVLNCGKRAWLGLNV